MCNMRQYYIIQFSNLEVVLVTILQIKRYMYVHLSVHHKSCLLMSAQELRNPLGYFHETWYKYMYIAPSYDVQRTRTVTPLTFFDRITGADK